MRGSNCLPEMGREWPQNTTSSLTDISMWMMTLVRPRPIILAFPRGDPHEPDN